MKYYQKVLFIISCGFCLCTAHVEADAFAQKIAIASSGAGVAVWNTRHPTYYSVDAATVSPTGVWSPSVTLSASGLDTSFPQIVIDPSGNAIAIWSAIDTASATAAVRVLQLSMLPSSGSSWSGPITISASGEDVAIFASGMTDGAYQLVMNDVGSIIAIWCSSMNSSLAIRSSSYDSNNKLWGFPQTISP